jgi:hypothetical protein
MEKKTEKSFYNDVAQWFRETKQCDDVQIGHKFSELRLLTGDVVGTKAYTKFACEVKAYPYPVGSQGFGAIGQALVLPADHVYVGYVACASTADCPEGLECSPSAGGVNRCTIGGPVAGELGNPCRTTDQCGSSICARVQASEGAESCRCYVPCGGGDDARHARVTVANLAAEPSSCSLSRSVKGPDGKAWIALVAAFAWVLGTRRSKGSRLPWLVLALAAAVGCKKTRRRGGRRGEAFFRCGTRTGLCRPRSDHGRKDLPRAGGGRVHPHARQLSRTPSRISGCRLSEGGRPRPERETPRGATYVRRSRSQRGDARGGEPQRVEGDRVLTLHRLTLLALLTRLR